MLCIQEGAWNQRSLGIQWAVVLRNIVPNNLEHSKKIFLHALNILELNENTSSSKILSICRRFKQIECVEETNAKIERIVYASNHEK